MLADRFPLGRRLQQARDLINQKKSVEKTLTDIARKVQSSSQKMAQRLEKLPKPEYPLDLPVSSRRDEIAKAIEENQVVIVCGETGSGKTTQLPKICLELGRGVSGLIGHTQPRRIAARSVATRIAQELNSTLGETVGFKVRFSEQSSESSYIKIMTDGILLAETQGDRFLNAYDTIIIDEAHERSLNIDFLLGFLKQLLPKRPDLKVIVTSATIDAERFGKHFESKNAKGQLVNAPIIEVSGRTFPVEVRYRPLGKAGFISHENAPDDIEDEEDTTVKSLHGIKKKGKTEARWLAEDDEEEAIEEAILDAADDLLRQGDGDILVFLPGEREIRDTADHLKKHQGRSPKLKHIEVLPLFARLGVADQQKIFKPKGQRRIVLATNVAETSLTVPGIKYVIDAGLARVNRYSTRAKVEQLQIEKISQAAAKQRSGRCGRVSSGICVRLYSEEDFNNRSEFTDPEIIRSSLASVILRMAALRLGDVDQFPFLEAPSSRLIADGYLQLQELDAVDANRKITDIGLQLSRLPLDPRVARMILAAKQEGCLQEVLIIASVISMQDPRERPMDKREAATNAHAKFAGEGSDFMSFLKIWDWYEDAFKNKKSNKELLNQCHANFLSAMRLREWRELYRQLREIVEELGMLVPGNAKGNASRGKGRGEQSKAANTKGGKAEDILNSQKEATYEQVHRALLAGLLGNIGFKDGDNDAYSGARSIRFHVTPGSCLKKSRPKWIMAAELVDTSKLYARCVAKIEPDWIEPLARNLTNSTYTDPRWDRKKAQVTAWERVSLYGLTVVPKRRVHYGPINVEISHEIFIREALANMELETKAPFLNANKRIIAEIEELEHKARRQDVLVDEHALVAFYDKIVPQDIVNGIGFEAWRKEAEKEKPKLLFLTKDDLMRHEAESVTESQFPETMEMDGATIQLKYRFEPGHVLDGVTATIPLALLNPLDATRAEWLVPGMLREKVTALIKILPKTFRRVCVPVPDFVTGFLEQAKIGARPILLTLVNYIEQQTSLKLGADDFMIDKLPEHFFMNFSVIDEKQRELGMGRDWHALKNQLGNAAQLTFRSGTTNNIEKSGIKQWDFGDIPATLTFSKEGHQLTGYPALVDEVENVSIKLFDTEQAAYLSHRAGVCRLMRFELKEQMKQLQKALPNFNQYALQLRNIISPEDLKEDLITTLADRAFVGEDDLPRSTDEFMALKQRARTRLPAVKDALFRTIGIIGIEYFALADKQAKMPARANRLTKDVESQVQQLLYKNCFSQTPWDQLQHLPRYLKGLCLRIEKQPSNPDRDGKHAASISLLWQKWQTEIEKQRKVDNISPELQDFRWLLEELRVSLFAQELKTPFPVSTKRLDKIWSNLT
ncbi:MAG: ATP-dependent RNA helicase HrpA [Methylophilaceae bacterium]|nr:ATP-dependent RNA helicase HrpA [Methylophilaceae bacterium]